MRMMASQSLPNFPKHLKVVYVAHEIVGSERSAVQYIAQEAALAGEWRSPYPHPNPPQFRAPYPM